MKENEKNGIKRIIKYSNIITLVCIIISLFFFIYYKFFHFLSFSISTIYGFILFGAVYWRWKYAHKKFISILPLAIVVYFPAFLIIEIEVPEVKYTTIVLGSFFFFIYIFRNRLIEFIASDKE